MRQCLETITVHSGVEEVVHNQLMIHLREYFILGGMPAIVQEYLNTKDFMACQSRQSDLLHTYKIDFGKYGAKINHANLLKMFESAPRLSGSRFKYVHVDPDIKSRDLKIVLDLLMMAGLIHPTYATAASGLLFGSQKNERKLKILFFDLGLSQNACGLQRDISISDDFIQVNSGALAEQFVGLEFLAYGEKRFDDHLYFGVRDQKNSQAEVDYVISIDSRIIPVEVKSGKTGRLKSLRIFLKEKKAPLAIRLSKQTLSFHDQILSLPFYMIAQAPRLVRSHLV